MKNLAKNLEDLLADAALLEEGVSAPAAPGAGLRLRHFSEAIEESLVEVAFAEAADYDDIHEAILRERRALETIARPDDCQYGDNDLCFV